MLFRPLRRPAAVSKRFDGYQIIRLVHEGHKTSVFQARYGQSPELYAVKLYTRTFDRQVRRLKSKYGLWSEGEVGQAMNPLPNEDPKAHPIVRTVGEGHEFGKNSKPYYVVQTFVEGYNLKNLIAAGAQALTGRRLDIALGIARGLDVIHRSGFVHRDICSDNILLNRSWMVRLIDLGFCAPTGMRFAEKSGTASYMSPEQIRGGELAPASDIYSFGVVLYELFAGALPFGAATRSIAGRMRTDQRVLAAHLSQQPRPPQTVSPHCPQGVGSTIMDCLEKAPGRRPGDARELIRKLENAQEQYGPL